MGAHAAGAACAVLSVAVALAFGPGPTAAARDDVQTLKHPTETATAPAARYDGGPDAVSASGMADARDAARFPGRDEPDRPLTYTYDVAVRGEVATDPGAFAEQAAAILDDERGWALDGELGFSQVPEEGDVTLVLASPAVVGAAHPVCSRRFSCRVGNEVLVNDRAWREATPAFRQAGGDLTTYRRYVLQHEVGHWLGYGHRDCPGDDEPAPVMHQQSISLAGCTPRAWPLPHERAAAADDHLP